MTLLYIGIGIGIAMTAVAYVTKDKPNQDR